jgi:hypothetical protein
VGMNEIFLCRGSDDRISSQRAFMLDLRALPRLSRSIAAYFINMSSSSVKINKLFY